MVGDGQLKHWHLVAQGQLQGLGICRTLMYVWDAVPGGLVVKVFDFGGIDVGSNLVRAAWCPWTRHP